MFQINKILKNKDINLFLWFFSPILITLIIFIVKFLNINFFISYFKGESGIIENGTFFVLFFSIIITCSVLTKLKKKINLKNLYFIIIVFLIGLIYFTGEEISWGQQWFDWETNEFFKKNNDQSETNFHNISSWFDQKPRFLLTYFVIIAGITCPLLNRKNIFNENKLRFWIYPTIYCFPTSLVCLFYYLLDNSYKFLCYGTPGIDINCKYLPILLHIRTSEIIELYISLFLLIYILSINSRLKKIN